ncbi:hypothetical protein CPB85DRAFT_1262584 [Mucidula mucida]|nr:hypothetical protein CPB85DRAFT_1262584 [Mucidula mucida]
MAGRARYTLRECSTYSVGEGSMERGLSGSLRRFNPCTLQGVKSCTIPVEGWASWWCGQYVDGESVYASTGSKPVLYPLKASQAAGVANTLRECSTYTVGEGDMGRGLRDVDGESVYASTGSKPVLYPLKASQAAGVANVRSRFGRHGLSRIMTWRAR